MAQTENGITYKDSGVSIEAGELSVSKIRDLVSSTHDGNVIGAIGGFGGLYRLDRTGISNPVLVSSTDGVGTKSYVATMTGRFDTIGVDLVAMCVDDLVCTGARPLFLLDYVSVESLDPQIMHQIVSGVADGCKLARCSLIGGEMAEHPREVSSDPKITPDGKPDSFSFDLAGFAVGLVDRDKILSPQQVQVGDVLIGVGSPGIRCNGYSLARHVLFNLGSKNLDDPAWESSPYTLAQELLRPSVIYAPAIVDLVSNVEVHGVAHITGGGICGNLSRVLPSGARAQVCSGTWEVPRIFCEIQEIGNISIDEMSRVFNLGIGMICVVPPHAKQPTIDLLQSAGHPAHQIGTIDIGGPGPGSVIDWSGVKALRNL